MANRHDRQVKLLHTKIANLDNDIKRLETELEPLKKYETIDVNAILNNNANQQNTITELDSQLSTLDAELNTITAEKMLVDKLDIDQLQAEDAIYNVEMRRLNILTDEWKKSAATRKADMLLMLDQKKNRVLYLETELDNKRALLSGNKEKKRHLRRVRMEGLIQNQQAYKLELDNYEKRCESLESLRAECDTLQAEIDDYVNQRYIINKDYYDWKNELDMCCQKLGDTMIDAETTHKLQTTKQILMADTRQDYKNRFIMLDEKIRDNTRKLTKLNGHIARMDNQITNMEKPAISIVTNEHMATANLEISHETSQMEHEIHDLEKELDICKCDVITLETQITALAMQINADRVPDDIIFVGDRARERLRIIHERISAKRESRFVELTDKADAIQRAKGLIRMRKDTVGKLLEMSPDINKYINECGIYAELKSLYTRLCRERQEILEQLGGLG